ncbi:MAG TPA: methylated-DNA--[protein]-cysteine S-methyltransferase [Devosiaceae bacterium]
MNTQNPIRPSSDYEAVRAAIAYLSANGPDATDLDAFARAIGMNTRQMTNLFRRWCGLSPKSFAQAVALDHAKKLLSEKASVLATTYEVGLSSTSRLHDLFVTYEAMPPGVYRARGEGIGMRWGVAASPFGQAVFVLTDYGLAGLAFADPGNEHEAFDDLRRRWPNARFERDDAVVAPLASRIFDPTRWNPRQPVRVVLIGTDFELRVWEALLDIPMGRATTYGALAGRLGRPNAARAIGSAVGRNPVSFVVPCHRVVGSSGQLTGYHWGLLRKRAILGWETGITASGG